MKNWYFILLTALISGCNSNTPVKDDSQQKLQLKVYAQAMDVGDLNTAIVAMQNLWALDSAAMYRDSLAMLYFENGRYAQSAQIAANVLRNDHDNRKYLEILARSLQGGGKIQEAAGYYERLGQLTGDETYDYQIAALNFNASDLQKSEAYIMKILTARQADTTHIKIFNKEGVAQNIPLKAAAFNLLGSIQAE